ncbi:MAG: SDR family NAD(P)-dependent oxidoreductase [Litorimonas sp.]
MSVSSSILITGATSGLGREMATQMASRGENVIATGRRVDRLEDLESHANISGMPLDLTSDKNIATFCEKLGPISGIVLNAGITFADDFLAGDLETDAALVQTNVSANLQLIRRLLPKLKESEGRILIVASLGGLVPVPYQSVYAGTKAFMVNFGLSLREELKDENIQVSVFAPGGIQTEMTDIPAMSHLEKNLAPVSDVAEAAIKAYDDMPNLMVPGVQNKFVAAAGKLMPRGFMARQAAKIYRK